MSRSICSIEGCSSYVNSRGYCSKHAHRLQRYGSPHISKNASPGNGSITKGGYRIIRGVMEHRSVAEAALGRPLPANAVVHHRNCDRLDNRSVNLVICPDAAYHRLIHRRMDALEQSGHANWRLCNYCKTYDDPANMYISPNGRAAYHNVCCRSYQKRRRQLREALDQELSQYA